jgi:hypothetical protein
MANKTTFTPEEWKQVLESVVLSGMAVTAADPSGLFGVLKESMATGRSLIAAKSDPESNELIRAVADDFATSEGRQAARERLSSTLQGSKAADVRARSIAAIHEIASLIDKKAPDEAPGFKTWLQHIAASAADAANEGGFMGFGGVQVSDKERATLAELSGALGIQSAKTGQTAAAATTAGQTAGKPSQTASKTGQASATTGAQSATKASETAASTGSGQTSTTGPSPGTKSS